MKDKVKKALKRVASGLMAAIFAVCLVGTPRVKAVAVVDDVAVGAMSAEAFLASIGLPLTATGGSSAVTAGVTAAAGEYAAATGAAASGTAFLSSIAPYVAVAAGGFVIGYGGYTLLNNFAEWLRQDKELSTTVGEPQMLYSDSSTYLIADDGTKFNVGYLSGGGEINSVEVRRGSAVNGTYTFNNGSISISVSTVPSTENPFNPYITTVSYTCGGKDYTYSHYTDSVFFSKLGNYLTGLVYVFSYKLGNETYISYQSLNGLELNSKNSEKEDKELSVTELPTYVPVEIGETEQLKIDVGAASGTTLADLAQTVPDAIANGQFAPTYVIQVAPSVDPGPVPVLPPEVDPTPEVDAPEDIAPYTVGLGEVFPFCIPFDIYHMVTMFAAEPEAPAATWEFTLPWSGQECEVSWSLEEWDEVAKLCRSLELVLFCVGLAAATYKMIKW